MTGKGWSVGKTELIYAQGPSKSYLYLLLMHSQLRILLQLQILNLQHARQFKIIWCSLWSSLILFYNTWGNSQLITLANFSLSSQLLQMVYSREFQDLQMEEAGFCQILNKTVLVDNTNALTHLTDTQPREIASQMEHR